MLDAAYCGRIGIPLVTRLANRRHDVNIAVALEGDDAGVGDGLQTRGAHILAWVPDEAERFGVGKIELVRRYPTLPGLDERE